jgi:hypothetical protein
MSRRYVLFYDKQKDELQRDDEGFYSSTIYINRETYTSLEELTQARERYLERGYRTKIVYFDD